MPNMVPKVEDRAGGSPRIHQGLSLCVPYITSTLDCVGCKCTYPTTTPEESGEMPACAPKKIKWTGAYNVDYTIRNKVGLLRIVKLLVLGP